MKMNLINYVCFLLLFSYIWNSCEDPIPSKASDCALSQADKNDGNAYCCYVKVGSTAICEVHTEEDHEYTIQGYKVLNAEYECNVEESCYMNLSVIFALLLTILSI